MRQAPDTDYVVARLHYVLFGGALFGSFAGLFHWWPKVVGRLPDEPLGKLQILLLLVGFNATFMPMHMLGLLGVPTRYSTYSRGGPRETYNLISTIGSGIMAIGLFVFVWNVVQTHALRRGVRAGNDRWLGETLEWCTTSPPPSHNFDRVPYVTSARPLRDLRRRLAGAGT